MKLTATSVLICVLLLCSNVILQSQTKRVLINTPDSVYELTGAGGSCAYSGLPTFCPSTYAGFYSSALYKQTFYFLTVGNTLYSVELSNPGSCRLVINLPGFSMNALTVDKNGMLYAVENATRKLYRIDPYTSDTAMLGRLPVQSGGDLVFYGDKLLLSTAGDGLYEINLSNPAASTQYMPTAGYSFWGLISFPDDCEKNKVYGFSPINGGTILVELDLEKKTVGSIVCSMPILVFDAASIVETGNTLGIWVDSIQVEAPCEASDLTGNVNIKAYSATAGALKYTLNNGMENTTGRFEQLLRGTYQVKITNARGCVKDTSFTIRQGMSPNITVTTTNPETCELSNGSIFIEAFSTYLPITIRVNDGPAQINKRLTGLGAGVFKIAVRDQGSCGTDTTIVLKYDTRPEFPAVITTQPTFCEAQSGSIGISIPGNSPGFTASLNGGSFQAGLQFNQLKEGYYRLSILNTNNCRYDTLVHIGKDKDPAPQVTLTITNQLCFENNGKLVAHVTGAGAPFQFNLDNSNYGARNSFDKLAPGFYKIGIRNSNYCLWDSVVEIKQYIKQPVNVTVIKKDPTCRAINSGELRVNIAGAESPYFFEMNNKVYGQGDIVANIAPGEYLLKIFNKDQCMVESQKQELVLHYEPECDRMSMPNAFSPNNDGNNDVFKPLHSPYVTQVSLVIYNRYGQIVFRNSATHPGWNGTLNGKQVDQGNYAWKLTYRNFRGETKNMNGLVLVVR